MALKLEIREPPVGRFDKDLPVPGQIPLVFGIAGHRDLRDQDRETLKNGVRSIFQEYRARCPSTPPALLSPLAAGADRLAARVALECGLRLIVPLPRLRALYEMDFETSDSRTEFDTLLWQADGAALSAGH